MARGIETKRGQRRIEAHFHATTALAPDQTSIIRQKMAIAPGYFDQTVRFT